MIQEAQKRLGDANECCVGGGTMHKHGAFTGIIGASQIEVEVAARAIVADFDQGDGHLLGDELIH